jgi:hypothetical protein
MPNLPPLPGLPADILQQAQQQQDNALNLHMERQRAIEAALDKEAKEERLRSEEDEEELEGEGDESIKEAVDEDDNIVNNGGRANNGDAISVHNESSLSPAALAAAAPPSSKKRHRSRDSEDCDEVSSPKKAHHTLGLPGANIKIASRGTLLHILNAFGVVFLTHFLLLLAGDGRNGDSSLVVSLEINGTTYQGVLFAQPGKHRSSS